MSYFELYRTKPALESLILNQRLRFNTDAVYTEYLLSQSYSENLHEREYTLTNGKDSNPVKLPIEISNFIYALKTGKVNRSLGYGFFDNIKLNKYLDGITLPSVKGNTYNKLPNHYMFPLFRSHMTLVTTEDVYDEDGNYIGKRETKTDYHSATIIYLEPDSPHYGMCCAIPIAEYDDLSDIYLKDNWWIFKALQSKFDHDLTYYISEKGLKYLNNQFSLMNDKIMKSNLLSMNKK